MTEHTQNNVYDSIDVDDTVKRLEAMKIIITNWDTNEKHIDQTLEENSFVKKVMKSFDSHKHTVSEKYSRNSFKLYTKTSVLYVMLNVYSSLIQYDDLMEPLIV